MRLAQGHNAVTAVRLEPAALLSRVKHSFTEPLPLREGEVSHTCYMHFSRMCPSQLEAALAERMLLR